MESKFPKRIDQQDTETDPVKVLRDTKELVWSNQLRAKALRNGIQTYVTKVLGSEKTYNTCFYFLAKEFGGANTY